MPAGDDGRDPAPGEESTAVVGAARLRTTTAIAPGTVLAERYQIENRLGEGGSGTVFRAWDRMLGEVLAVKILHPQRARERSWIKRLAREVKVARLIRHPNVCRVFELGHADGHWFVTMELAPEGSLRDRLQRAAAASAPGAPSLRPLADRLSDIRQLCAGLGAIHAVGITHRDVTPQNVLVMADGRLILTDFGLATARGDKTTVIGGTPAYMPPEAARGDHSDQRSDVFQLGMIMHEVLTGVRPKWTADGARLQLVEPTANASAPEIELARVVAACVEPDPARRPPTALAVAGRLAAAEAAREAMLPVRLIGRLQRFGRRHARLLKVGAAALALVVVARTAQWLSRPPLCEGGPAHIAGIWDTPRAEAVRRAFVATKKDYAPASFARVRAILDDFSRDWIRMYTDACEATQLRGEQSAEVLDLRMSCLNDRTRDLRALTDLLSSPDGEVVARSINAASGLTPVAVCGDVSVLRAVVPPPVNPETRAKVERLRQWISDVKALHAAGRYVDGARRVQGLVVAARALGYEPLLAEALQIEGELDMWTSSPDVAVSVMNEALLHAEASRHDRVLAEVAVYETNLLTLSRRFEELDRLVPRARATLARIGGDPRLEAWVDTAVADSLQKRDRYDEALAMDRQALALMTKALGKDHWEVALSLGNIAQKLHLLGRDEEALVENGKTIDVLERALGAEHPDLALHLSNRGEIHLALGSAMLARADFERALSIWKGDLPPDHLYLSYALTGLGRARLAEGNAREAIPPLARALAIREGAHADAELRAETKLALAEALWTADDDRPRAIRLAEAARDQFPDARAADRQRAVEVLAKWRGGKVTR